MEGPAGAWTGGGDGAVAGVPLPGSYANPGTSFVGRDGEVAEVVRLIEAHRLVTLTGPGGSGKTRLAVAVAQQLGQQGIPVTFVELAPVSDGMLVPAAIAAALGLRATADLPAHELVLQRIADSRRLIVLDNLEHLLAAGAFVAELVTRCRRVRVVATSRVRLRLSMEIVREVPPLEVPKRPASLGATPGRDTAVRLFIDRVRTVSDHSLSSDEVGIANEIVRRVGGLPLALELTAARARQLSLAMILARLDDPLPLLAGGPTDAPDRHRSMRNTIAWSYSLLDQPSAVVFGRASVFAGDFDLEAAHAVAGPGITTSDGDLLNLMTGLVEHRILGMVPSGGSDPRFVLHETIREFGSEVIDDEAAARDRHLEHYLRLAEAADAELDGPDQASWMTTLVRELEQLRAALAWASRSSAQESLLRLAAALGNFWRWHGDLREGDLWLTRALSVAPERASPPRAKAERRVARILAALGDRDRAIALFESARASSDATGDPIGAADALIGLGLYRFESARPETALAPLDLALSVAAAAGDIGLLAEATYTRGHILHYLGELDEADARYDEAMVSAKQIGRIRLIASIRVNQADIRLAKGDHAGAIPLLVEAIEHLEAIGDLAYRPWANIVLAMALRRQWDMEGARRAIVRGGRLALDRGVPEDLVLALEVLGDWLREAGAPAAALRAWSAAAQARDDQALPLAPSDQAWLEPSLASARSALDDATAAREWREGRAVAVDEAVESALSVVEGLPSGGIATRGRDRAGLTKRELEVLSLLARGRTDGEIALELFISPKTASVHVANIKGKLGASTRVEIVTTAIRLGLVEVARER